MVGLRCTQACAVVGAARRLANTQLATKGRKRFIVDMVRPSGRGEDTETAEKDAHSERRLGALRSISKTEPPAHFENDSIRERQRHLHHTCGLQARALRRMLEEDL